MQEKPITPPASSTQSVYCPVHGELSAVLSVLKNQVETSCKSFERLIEKIDRELNEMDERVKKLEIQYSSVKYEISQQFNKFYFWFAGILGALVLNLIVNFIKLTK